MATEQNTNAPTNEHSLTSVSFEDVSLTTLKKSFNDTYKVSKGSASQTVLGFMSMSERLTEPTNEYQQTLYPKLKELCQTLYTTYENTFLTDFDCDTQKQVFGANLNGNRNNGSLYRSIPSGVNKTLSYNYAQFGQLVRVLTSRLRFIVQRDPNNVQRYKTSQDEFSAYQKLQTKTKEFLEQLEKLSHEWNTLVSETRVKYGVETKPRTQHREHREHQRPRQRYQTSDTEHSEWQQVRQKRSYSSRTYNKKQ